MTDKTYNPNPVDTTDIQLPEELVQLTEPLARHVHEVWSKWRIAEGWKYGLKRNDELKETPCLVPYDELEEGEKEYDRKTALETLKYILSLGYNIVR